MAIIAQRWDQLLKCPTRQPGGWAAALWIAVWLCARCPVTTHPSQPQTPAIWRCQACWWALSRTTARFPVALRAKTKLQLTRKRNPRHREAERAPAKADFYLLQNVRNKLSFSMLFEKPAYWASLRSCWTVKYKQESPQTQKSRKQSPAREADCPQEEKC